MNRLTRSIVPKQNRKKRRTGEGCTYFLTIPRLDDDMAWWRGPASPPTHGVAVSGHSRGDLLRTSDDHATPDNGGSTSLAAMRARASRTAAHEAQRSAVNSTLSTSTYHTAAYGNSDKRQDRPPRPGRRTKLGGAPSSTGARRDFFQEAAA